MIFGNKASGGKIGLGGVTSPTEAVHIGPGSNLRNTGSFGDVRLYVDGNIVAHQPQLVRLVRYNLKVKLVLVRNLLSFIIDFTSEVLIPILAFQVHMLELLVIPF